MRIIAGAFRGRLLEAPSGQRTRPTADRVRESLFSMLVSRLGTFEDVRVADLFAGSGALGFEALSRGAAHVTFVETDRPALQAIAASARRLGVSNQVAALACSATALPRCEQFDLILADPPYAPGSGTAVVESVARSEWLAPGGILAVETERDERVDAGPYGLILERIIGRARVTLLSRP